MFFNESIELKNFIQNKKLIFMRKNFDKFIIIVIFAITIYDIVSIYLAKPYLADTKKLSIEKRGHGYLC